MHNYENKVIEPSSFRNSNKSIVLPSAIAGGIILIVYFLLISMLGYETSTSLRFLNFILLIPVIVYSLNSYITKAHNKSYLEAMRIAIFSFFGSYLMLAIFMFFYLILIDRELLVYLRTYVVPGVKLNAFGAAAMIIGEGAIGAVVLSFVVLQFFKDRIRKVA